MSHWPSRHPSVPPPWVSHLLEHGFSSNPEGQFIRESTSIRIADDQLVIESPPGKPIWSLDLTGADEHVVAHAVEMLLDFRPTLRRPQRTEAEIEDLRVERALNRIETIIAESPNRGFGVTLRHFLWALHNQRDKVRLLQTVPVMDPFREPFVSTVRTAAWLGQIPVEAVKSALKRAGEIRELGDHRPYEEWVITIEEAMDVLGADLKRSLPAPTQEAVRRAIAALEEAREALRSTERPRRSPPSPPTQPTPNR